MTSTLLKIKIILETQEELTLLPSDSNVCTQDVMFQSTQIVFFSAEVKRFKRLNFLSATRITKISTSLNMIFYIPILKY